MTKPLHYPFSPLWPFHSGWAQTIAATFFPQRSLDVVDAIHQVRLPDQDVLVICENTPKTWKPGDRIVVLVHGLTGSAFSKDSSRLACVFTERGFRVFRVNLRNCGPGFGMAKKIYHSGRSEDTRAVIEFISKLSPGSPITQIGFSLGGNITLKMAGEGGFSAGCGLDSVVAVSPPADLAASSRKLSSRENRFFDSYFVKRLCRDVSRLNAKDPEFFLPEFPKKLTLRGFDDLYTAPSGGFTSAADYYNRASSLHLIPDIPYRTLIIGSDDDPVVDMTPLKALRLQSHQTLVVTERGGHCGYLGFGPKKTSSLRWMDHMILDWMTHLRK